MIRWLQTREIEMEKADTEEKRSTTTTYVKQPTMHHTHVDNMLNIDSVAHRQKSGLSSMGTCSNSVVLLK